MIDLRLYPDTASMLALFSADPVLSPPGERSAYSTFGYTLAAAAIEGAAGKGFVELMDAELLKPLGLCDAIRIDDMRAIVPGRAAFYDLARDGESVPARSIVNAYPLNSAYKRAGGGFLATAEGLVRFGAAHFEPGFFEPVALELLFTEQTTNQREPLGVGLGWRIGKDKAGRRIFHHSGSQAGCRAGLVVYPDQKAAVAVLSNLSNSPEDIGATCQSIAEAFLAPARP
jgi:CubicO group peptidase (beta-lactamase class C family)